MYFLYIFDFMSESKPVNLEECIQNFEDIHLQKKKNFDKILTSEQYIQLIRSEFIPDIEYEINGFNEFFNKSSSENLDYDIFRNKIIKSFQILLPKYESLKSIVVTSNCETSYKDILSFLYDFTDNLKLVSSIYVPSEIVLSKEQIIKLCRVKFPSYKRKHTALINSLNKLEASEKLKSFKFTFLKLIQQKTRYVGRKLFILFLFAPILLTFLFYFSEFFIHVLSFIENLVPLKVLSLILDVLKSSFLYLLGKVELLNNFIITHHNSLKISVWFLSILWIPALFLRKIPRYHKELFLLMISASIYVLFIYKPFIKGFLLVLGLFLYPLYGFLSMDSSKIEKVNSNSRKTIFYPTLTALLISFLITQEPIWLIGFIIWSCFIFVAKISYKYFVPTFSSLSKQDTEKDKEIVIDPWIFIALFVSCIFLGTGFLENLDNSFLSELYLNSIQIALILIGFLLAAQGVVNSASLKSETKKGKLFEAQSLLRILEGFTGFMIVFLTLFVFAVLGYFSTTKFKTLSINREYLISPINFSSFSVSHFASLLIFCFFITLFVLSIFHLLYLFLSSSLILNPLKTAIISSPLLIENVTNMAKFNSIVETEDVDIEKIAIDKLKKDYKLNGKVMTSLLINKFIEDEGYYIGCEFEVVTPNKIDLMELSINLGINLIFNGKFSRVSILVRSKEGSLKMFKVFQVELTKEKLQFITRKDDLDLEYKFEQVGAFFWNPAFKESHTL